MSTSICSSIIRIYYYVTIISTYDNHVLVCKYNTLSSLQLNFMFVSFKVDLWRSMIPSPPQTAMTQNSEAAQFVKALDELRSAIFSLSKRNKKSTFQEGNMTPITATYVPAIFIPMSDIFKYHFMYLHRIHSW